MRFSVIMPSLLADYPGAATDRDKKLVRAIDSVLSQTFNDFELIVIADGCPTTKHIVTKHYTGIIPKLLWVERKKLWSNKARNEGIEEAAGEYITYIDNDDYWGPGHLGIINSQLTGEDWIYSNDWIWVNDQWRERTTDPLQYGRIGTSNICHASKLGLKWDQEGYGHDYHFIQQLLKYPNHKQIQTAQYYVCHFNGGYAI